MRSPSSSSGDRGAGSVVSTPSDRIRRPPRTGAKAMTDIQLLIVVAIIFGTGFTYWAWAISNTLMDILRVLKDRALENKP